MFPILKREIRSYLYSPISYVLIGTFIFLFSVFFLLFSVNYQKAEMAQALSMAGLILVFLIPLLTMKVLTDEKKYGTDVLLFTTPLSTEKIVLGKFFSICFLYIVMIFISLIYPATLMLFGTPSLEPIAGGYFGMLLLGISMISLGLFTSAFTDNQVVAAVFSFLSLLFMWIIDQIATSFGGVFGKILTWISLLSRWDDFSKGILDLRAVLYYISFTFVFVFLTVRVIEKRRWTKG